MMKQWQRFEESGKPVGLPGQTQEWRSMHDYHVVWSREAIYDVADIADYIELRFGRERADRFNDEIDAQGEALGRDFRMYTGT